MNKNYLIHFGVKGMKWGVRREQMQKSRLGARMERYGNKLERQLLKTVKKVNKLEARGIQSAKAENKMATIANALLTTRQFQHNTLKDLPPKVISRGKRQVMALGLLGLIQD